MAIAEFLNYRSRSRDIQDSFERHVWQQQRYVDGAGSVVNVRGTDTLDQDAPVLNSGYSFNLPENANTEVFLLSGGSDTNQKFALLTIPRNAQRQWPEGAGGIQHPTNPDLYLEFNDDGVILRHGRLTLGGDQSVVIDVTDGKATITGDLEIAGDVVIGGSLDVNGNNVNHNGTDIGDSHRHGGVESGPSSTGTPF